MSLIRSGSPQGLASLLSFQRGDAIRSSFRGRASSPHGGVVSRLLLTMDGRMAASKESIIPCKPTSPLGRWRHVAPQRAPRHFSVHYDGLVDDASLRSKERRGNIERLHAKGCPITAIVVGTPPALDGLSETLELFRRCGVKHYHLNCVSCEGRGAGSPQPNRVRGRRPNSRAPSLHPRATSQPGTPSS